MRPILIPVAAKTDANGAASIDVRLERTGDWRAVKIALGTTGPAEWSAVQSGVPVTFGRGRRVTLGPELMQPDDTLKIEVTGGPVLAQVTGSVSGIGGTMQEIIEAFKPEPNTIALDAAVPRQKLFPIGTTPPTNPATPSFISPAGASNSGVFQLPAGTIAIRVEPVKNPPAPPPVNFIVSVRGTTTNISYYPGGTGTGSLFSPAGTITIPVSFEWDPQVQVTVDATPSASPVNVFVSALFSAEPVGQGGAAQTVVVDSGKIELLGYDWTATGAFTGAGTPSVTQAATGTSDTILVVGVLSASVLVIGGGAATTPQLQLVDSIAGTIKQDWIAVPAAGPGIASPYQVPGLGYPIFGSATWQWDRVIGANQFATLTMAGWTQGLT